MKDPAFDKLIDYDLYLRCPECGSRSVFFVREDFQAFDYEQKRYIPKKRDVGICRKCWYKDDHEKFYNL